MHDYIDRPERNAILGGCLAFVIGIVVSSTVILALQYLIAALGR